jgi:hypothetical protein
MQHVLVIAHDAGGAEIVAAHVKAKRRTQSFAIFVSGPAERIFARERLRYGRLPASVREIRKLIAAHRSAAYLLAGTGGGSFELDVLKEAKRQGMRTIAYLESWSFYRERFGYPDRGWSRNLPDEIWVGDVPAKRLAERYFPHDRIRLVPNQYFKAARQRFRKIRRKRGYDILFLSASDWGEAHTSASLLEAFLSGLARWPHPLPVRIRPHPADAPTRYRALVRRYPGLDISFSDEKDLVRDIATARVTIGLTTTALAISAFFGVPAVCLASRKPDIAFSNLYDTRTPRAAVRKLFEIIQRARGYEKTHGI